MVKGGTLRICITTFWFNIFKKSSTQPYIFMTFFRPQVINFVHDIIIIYNIPTADVYLSIKINLENMKFEVMFFYFQKIQLNLNMLWLFSYRNQPIYPNVIKYIHYVTTTDFFLSIKRTPENVKFEVRFVIFKKINRTSIFYEFSPITTKQCIQSL